MAETKLRRESAAEVAVEVAGEGGGRARGLIAQQVLKQAFEAFLMQSDCIFLPLDFLFTHNLIFGPLILISVIYLFLILQDSDNAKGQVV